MSFGRDMLREIAPDATENPLGLLGLSREVLTLNLSEDELFSVCRRFAKSLLAEVHEDRVARTERTQYLQARFSNALMLLRDRSRFTGALSQLRAAISAERSEVRRLRGEVAEITEKYAIAMEEGTARDREMAKLRVEVPRALRLEGERLDRGKENLRARFKSQEEYRIEAKREAKRRLAKRVETVRRAELLKERERQQVRRHIKKARDLKFRYQAAVDEGVRLELLRLARAAKAGR